MASPYSSSTITSAFQLAATNHKPNNMPLIKNINLLDCIEILHTNRKGIMAQGKGEKKDVANFEMGRESQPTVWIF